MSLDPRRVALYQSLGQVRLFEKGEHHCLATIHPALPEVGAVGAWTGEPSLLAAAEDWLRDQGCTLARGPMELCTWFSYRATLGPFDHAPFAMEPTEPAGPWLEAGYQVAATYASALAQHESQEQSASQRGARLISQGWTVRSLAEGPDGLVPPDDFRQAVSLIHRLSTAAFGRAYAYAPVPEAALQAWYAPWRPHVVPSLCLVAHDAQGQPAGFLFGVPDAADPARGWFLVKTLAVLPEHRALGLGSWLVAEGHRRARLRGLSAGVHCLMWEGSLSRAISKHGGSIFRRYALLERPL